MNDAYNLIYNGDFNNGYDGWREINSTNVFLYDPSVTYDGSGGSVLVRGKYSMTTGTSTTPYRKLIQINTADTYHLEFDMIKSASGTGTCYCYFTVYDKYNKSVGINQVNHAGDTTLSSDLNDGDTVINVSDASGFYHATSTGYSIGICDSPSFGYNKWLCSQGIVASATDRTNNTVTLKAAWTGGTWKAGTKVARFSAGATYIYPYNWSKGPLNSWVHVTKDIGPSSWRYSSVSVKPSFTGWSGASGEWIYNVTNMKLVNNGSFQMRDYNGETPEAFGLNANIGKNTVASCSAVQELSVKKARYIRDWCSGSSSNQYNHWCEIQAWDAMGRNVALGSNASAVTSSGEIVNLTTPSYPSDIVNNSSNSLFNRGHVITKGTQYPSTLYISNGGNAKTGIIIDLGQVFELEKIVVWHYWSGGRTYMGTQTEVSIDKENWETVFDSATEGTYAETEGGHEINFNTMNASITKSGIYKTTELYEI